MRSTTTWLLLLGLVGTLGACSHPQGISDASKLDKNDASALLAPICDDASCSTCPGFLDAEADGPLSLERVLYGSFSYDGADEALVEVSGCGGHDVVALEHRGGEWHRFGWVQNVSLGECEQVEREEGTTGLVCHTPAKMHRQHKQTLVKVGVSDGKFKRAIIKSTLIPRSCEDEVLSSHLAIGDWRLSDDESTLHLEFERRCTRARPGQTVCEAQQEGVEPLSSRQKFERDVNFERFIWIGDFCDRRNLNEVIAQTAPKLEECVALGDAKAQTGQYIVQWKVHLDGGVFDDSSSVLEAPTDDPAVEACFERVISQMQFDKPDGGICIVNYPYFFKDGSYWEHACGSFDPPPLEWLEAQSR